MNSRGKGNDEGYVKWEAYVESRDEYKDTI